jgi:hypothetical protein
MRDVMPDYYKAGGYAAHDRLLDGLEPYERRTRIQGPLFVGLLVLTLIGPFVARGGRRAGSALFAIVAVELIVVPIAVSTYDPRYSTAAFGMLGAGAALGGWSLWRVVQDRRLLKGVR